ncbi:hypothetical protein [Nitrospirillum pindoramense]|uniref:hypothetical protein n=1 Tax=Nitrospirillum amazonense TaxID=28077 RepID=UPI0011A65D18|nr:hypothetical protein [Nitrospirillum amazonense]
MENIDKNENCDNEMQLDILYRGKIPKIAEKIKIFSQFSIGFSLMAVMLLKGFIEILQTFEMIPPPLSNNGCFIERVYSHFTGIHTFKYIAAALAISAGFDLGYMLFTDGPDEALTPLLLCISSAAIYNISASPEKNWEVGIYVISIFVLICCMHLYKKWGLERKK